MARAVTGRDGVVMFDGKYHGHADELLGALEDDGVAPEGLGIPRDATQHVRLVQYNDLDGGGARAGPRRRRVRDGRGGGHQRRRDPARTRASMPGCGA